MNVTRKAIAQVTETVLGLGARRAVKIISPKLTVKATRRHRQDKRNRQTEMVLTIGGPNYAERQFIKAAKAAGESFPIRKMLLKWYKRKKR